MAAIQPVKYFSPCLEHVEGAANIREAQATVKAEKKAADKDRDERRKAGLYVSRNRWDSTASKLRALEDTLKGLVTDCPACREATAAAYRDLAAREKITLPSFGKLPYWFEKSGAGRYTGITVAWHDACPGRSRKPRSYYSGGRWKTDPHNTDPVHDYVPAPDPEDEDKRPMHGPLCCWEKAREVWTRNVATWDGTPMVFYAVYHGSTPYYFTQEHTAREYGRAWDAAVDTIRGCRTRDGRSYTGAHMLITADRLDNAPAPVGALA